jgi:hypothetical protein
MYTANTPLSLQDLGASCDACVLTPVATQLKGVCLLVWAAVLLHQAVHQGLVGCSSLKKLLLYVPGPPDLDGSSPSVNGMQHSLLSHYCHEGGAHT